MGEAANPDHTPDLPARHRVEIRHYTPSIPTSQEIQITWDIEDIEQLLQKRSTDAGTKIIRKSDPLQVHVYQTTSSQKKILQQIAFSIKIDKNEDEEGITGCFLSGTLPHKRKNMLFQVVLPNGSIKKSNFNNEWSIESKSRSWQDFLSENLNFSECGLHHIGDGGIILRASAEIMVEGWQPCQPGQRHRIWVEDQPAAVGKEAVASSLRLVFSSMLESSEFSDVSLVCRDGQTFSCHKSVLSAWSAVFKAMFAHSDMLEGKTNTVSIQDIKPNAVKALLKFMYSGHLECETDDQLDVLVAADKYDVPSIKNLCLEMLIDRLSNSPGDVPRVIEFTDLHDDLKCLRYAAIQALSAEKDDTIMSSEGWGLLCKTEPQVALRAIHEAKQLQKANARIECGCWK